MSVRVAAILAEADRLLQPARYDDYCPNGLQVPGPDRGPDGALPEVSTIATGVSASAELFELAAAVPAELLLVHHGLFWGSGFATIDAQLRRRLRLLFDADLALAAYHLPLDAHPQLGNNALLARALGATRLDIPFALHHGEPIGCLAQFGADENGRGLKVHEGDGTDMDWDGDRFQGGDVDEDGDADQGRHVDTDADNGLTVDQLVNRVRTATGRDPLVFDSGPAHVRTLAIVSGGGSDYIAEASLAGADAFLTGEPTERMMALARELRITYIAAGHYATETFGVRALGAHLAERFSLRHVFLDVPNPV